MNQSLAVSSSAASCSPSDLGQFMQYFIGLKGRRKSSIAMKNAFAKKSRLN